MTNHRRCTGCKEEVGEYGIRHKYHGGLFCQRCMDSFRGGFSQVQSGWSLLRNIWGFLKEMWHNVFDPRRFGLVTKKADTKHYSAIAHAREIRERTIILRHQFNQKH